MNFSTFRFFYGQRDCENVFIWRVSLGGAMKSEDKNMFADEKGEKTFACLRIVHTKLLPRKSIFQRQRNFSFGALSGVNNMCVALAYTNTLGHDRKRVESEIIWPKLKYFNFQHKETLENCVCFAIKRGKMPLRKERRIFHSLRSRRWTSAFSSINLNILWAQIWSQASICRGRVRTPKSSWVNNILNA